MSDRPSHATRSTKRLLVRARPPYLAGGLLALSLSAPAWATDTDRITEPPRAAGPESAVEEWQELQRIMEEALAEAEAERDRLQSAVAEAETARDDARAEVSEQAERLAELETERDRLQTALAEAETARDDARAETSEQTERLAELEAERETLQSELTAERESHTAKQTAFDQSESARRELEETLANRETGIQELVGERENLRDRRADLETERNRLEQALAEARGRMEAQAAELEEVRAERDALESKEQQLRATLPETEGGELDLETAQAAASETAAALMEQMDAIRRGDGDRAALEDKAEQLADELRHRQRLVSRVMGGTLYEIQRGQTLGDIARRFYGDANRWPAIFEANQHVLDGPDLLRPGFPLVLP